MSWNSLQICSTEERVPVHSYKTHTLIKFAFRYGNECGHDYNIPKTRMSWYIESFLPHSQSLTTLDLRKCLVNFESIKKIILNCVELREANFSKVLFGQYAWITEEETAFFCQQPDTQN